MAQQKLILDGHVHLYDCFAIDDFLAAAVNNLGFWAGRLYPGENLVKILMLTEAKGVCFFDRLKNREIGTGNRVYNIRDTGDPAALAVMEKGGNAPLLYLLAGRQIVTAENLEILALATDRQIEDGLPGRQVLDRLKESQDIAVLAWGVGKWFFKRRQMVGEWLIDCVSPYLFLGDNSARPRFWPRPALFKLAEKRGIPVIGGSDPLPFPTEATRVGSYGFILEGEFDPAIPARSVRRMLISNSRDIVLFGNRDSAPTFWQRQSRILCRKYLPGKIDNNHKSTKRR